MYKFKYHLSLLTILLALLGSLHISSAQQDSSNLIPQAQSLTQTMLEANPQLTQHKGGFSVANLIGGFIFSGIGFVSFTYGKKMSNFKLMVFGLVLIIYPYFIASTVVMYIIGILLCLGLYFFRE